MENMSLTTPALLFPAISLLLLAYTNRFLTLAQVIRQMHAGSKDDVPELILRQLAGEPVMGTALALDFQLQKRQSS